MPAVCLQWLRSAGFDRNPITRKKREWVLYPKGSVEGAGSLACVEKLFFLKSNIRTYHVPLLTCGFWVLEVLASPGPVHQQPFALLWDQDPGSILRHEARFPGLHA